MLLSTAIITFYGLLESSPEVIEEFSAVFDRKRLREIEFIVVTGLAWPSVRRIFDLILDHILFEALTFVAPNPAVLSRRGRCWVQVLLHVLMLLRPLSIVRDIVVH